MKIPIQKIYFCGIENYTINSRGSKVVLTIAHLNHNPADCRDENLRALCQLHHNRYDIQNRIKGIKERKIIEIKKKHRCLNEN